MNSNIIDNIIDSLLYVMPVLHKRLLRANPSHINPNIRLTRLHVMIMGSLYRDKETHASEIGRDLMILKPQMTRLIKELVDAGLVEQQPDTMDKRSKFLALTEQGKYTLRKFRQMLKKSIAGQLSGLNERELNEFSSLLTRLKQMGALLEKNGT